MSSDLLTIGELASRTGRRASSIRYYEEIGLLPEPVRLGGQRRYDPAAERTLAIIDTAQRAGLSLDEIKLLLGAMPGGDAAGDTAAVEQLREVAERKLPQLIAMIERAILVREWLEAASRCECPSIDACGLFDQASLQPDGQSRASRRAFAAGHSSASIAK
jgi:MerR family transcriptional regulator, redox-sensitive transcriptional activator SoxR